MDHLLKQDCVTEALALAWSFHEGKAKAVVGKYVNKYNGFGSHCKESLCAGESKPEAHFGECEAVHYQCFDTEACGGCMWH